MPLIIKMQILLRSHVPHLTTSRQSPSADKRKYSSPGRSWHSSSMFCSALSSSSCLFTRTSAATIMEKNNKKQKKEFYFFIAFLSPKPPSTWRDCCLLCRAFYFSFVPSLRCVQRANDSEGEFITQILISTGSLVVFYFFSLIPRFLFAFAQHRICKAILTLCLRVNFAFGRAVMAGHRFMMLSSFTCA